MKTHLKSHQVLPKPLKQKYCVWTMKYCGNPWVKDENVSVERRLCQWPPSPLNCCTSTVSLLIGCWGCMPAVSPSGKVWGRLSSMCGTPEPAGESRREECWECVLMRSGMRGMSLTGAQQGVWAYVCGCRNALWLCHYSNATTVRCVFECRRPSWTWIQAEFEMQTMCYRSYFHVPIEHGEAVWGSCELLCTLSRHIWMLSVLLTSLGFFK